MAHMDRPNRAVVIDETGARRTLAAGEAAFEALTAGGKPLFLGLGPDPGVAAALAGGEPADWLECPDFEAAMGPDWLAGLPAGWRRLTPGDLSPGRVRAARLIRYRQNSRLFPTFWGPILARVQLALLPGPDRAARSSGIILPRPPKGLLEPEIARALTALGRPAIDITPEACPAALAALLSSQTPSALLSINGAGLDDEGISAALLAEAGVPLAIWFVDNPFHIVGRFRGGFWKRALLAVTDDSFIEPLRQLGAARTLHLPLGASAHFFTATPTPGLADRAVFVGRSAFAGRDAFFAGCRLPDGLTDTARAMVVGGGRPDYFWWAEKLGAGPLWPGKAGRAAGLGAETASLDLRAGALAAVSESMPLLVYGDAGWRELFPESVTLLPPVDYFGALPGIYAGAGVTLNATSLLLPRGLTQRHFDVWAAGGCLITDATAGLELFPAALTDPVRYASPGQAGQLAVSLLAQPHRRADLAAAWREAIAAGHRYEHRLAALLNRLAADV